MRPEAGDIGWVQTKRGTRRGRWSSVLHYVRASPGLYTACSYSTPWTVTWRRAKLSGRCATCARYMERRTLNK